MNTLLEIFPGLTDVLCVVMAFCLVAFIWASWLVLSWGRDTPAPREDRAESTEVQR